MFALRPNPARYQDKTIMVVGAGHIQEPAIKTAKLLGLRVVAVDQNANAPGLKWADYPLAINTSDVQACIEAARLYGIAGVMTSGSDLGARTAAEVAASLGLPGVPVQAALNATNKITIRTIMETHSIPAPRFTICHSREEAYQAMNILGLPLVVKPPDSHSSLGVSLIKDAVQLAKALDWAASFSQSGIWVLEEYVAAILNVGTVESFVVDGEVKVIAFLCGAVTPPPYRGITWIGVPADLPEETRQAVQEIVTRAVRAMGITCGPVHTQFQVSAQGPRLIEIAPRLAGVGVSSHLIPLALGINIIQAAIDVSLGYSPDLNPQYRRGACQYFFTLPAGTVQEIPLLEQFADQDLIETKLFIKPGDTIPEYCSFAVAPGYCISVGDTAELAKENAARVCAQIAGSIIVK